MRASSRLIGLLFWASLCAETPAVFRDIDRSMRELTGITGLPARKKVRAEIISRDRVHQFLKDRVKEVVKPEDLRVEELTLKKFGFIPSDFDLAKSTVELLTEQAAAFYDFRRKKLFLTDWTSSGMQESALVHELAHALADQNFGLERFIRDSGHSDDSSLARMAVMEGQASWLMAEAMAQRRSQSLLKDPSLLEAMGGADSEGSQYPVFAAAPLYLRETLVFPYTHGMRFQHALVEKMGQAAFSRIFRKPPVTTQQILHPEKYFAGEEPARTALPIERIKGYRKVGDGMIGELDVTILLRQYGMRGEAQEIGPHWRGGAYALWERRASGRSVLAHAVEWDSEEAAGRYFGAYHKVLAGKWKKLEIAEDSPRNLAGRGDDGYFQVRWSGRVVTAVEGLERAAAR